MKITHLALFASLFCAASCAAKGPVVRGREAMCHRLAFARTPPQYKVVFPSLGSGWSVERTVFIASSIPPIDAVLVHAATGTRISVWARPTKSMRPLTAAACHRMRMEWQGVELRTGVTRIPTYGTWAKSVVSFPYVHRERARRGMVAFISFGLVPDVLVLIEGAWPEAAHPEMSLALDRLVSKIAIYLAEGAKR